MRDIILWRLRAQECAWIDCDTKYEWIGNVRNNIMKITKTQLKEIIKEELSKVLDEGGAMGHFTREPTDRMSHSNLPVDSYSREELQKALSDVAKYEQPKYAGSLPDWMPQWIEDVKRRAAEEGILS